MDPLDPYRAANLLIQQDGKDAEAYAVQRVQDASSRRRAR